MNVKSMIVGAVAVLGLAAGAQAQETLDGSDVDAILELARGHGEAELQKQQNGDPKILGKVGGIQYAVYFMNCSKNKNCEDLNFYAGFLDLKPSLEVINDWNREKRFGKAYLDADKDAVIEMDLNLEHGVSSDNLDAAFSVWELVVDQYTQHIGYK